MVRRERYRQTLAPGPSASRRRLLGATVALPATFPATFHVTLPFATSTAPPAAIPTRHAQAAQPLPGTGTDATPMPLSLATATPGGGFALYGETLERVLNRRAGRAVLHAVPTRGTAENLELLARGQVDAALIQGTSASEALAPGGAGGLRILFAMYPSPGLLATPSASPLRRLEDAAGRKVVFGVRASGLVTLARQVFAGIGMDIERDIDALFVEQAAQSPRRVLSGEAVALWGAGEGWPGFTQLATAPGGARFIGPAPAQIPEILRRFPLLRPMEVPPDTYPGIIRPLPTVGSVNLILVRPDLDDARVDSFARAMIGATAELAAALPQAAFSTLENTWSSAPSPALLHRAVPRAVPRALLHVR